MSLDVADKSAIAKIATTVREIPHDQLRPSELNPRKHARSDAEIHELAQSIADKGVLQNLVARPMIGVVTDDGRPVYEIGAGEGRWRAVGMLLERSAYDPEGHVPVSVRELGDEDMIEIGLIENMQRKDLTPLEEGRAFLALHSAAFKRGGKKAAGAAVKRIAERVHKTERFVEKRIALVRDLEPAAAEMLDAGRIDLAAAQILSKAPAKEQQRIIKGAREQEARTEAEPIDLDDSEEPDPLSVGEISSQLTHGMRDLKTALFDLSMYKGDTIPHRGRAFAIDVKAFDVLQKEAAAELTIEYRGKEKAGEIAFFETGDHFSSWNYDQDKENAAGGVFMEKARDGRIAIYTGLTARARSSGGSDFGSTEYKERQKQRERQKDRQEARTILDPRLEKVVEHVGKTPKIALAIALYYSLSGLDYQAKFGTLFRNRNGSRLTVHMWEDAETKTAGMKVLKSVGSVPKGQAMLSWLLEQNLSTLATAWAAMAATDFVEEIKLMKDPDDDVGALLDACGAKLDEGWLEKAETAAKARVDALDSKKKGKGKKAKKKGGGK